MLAAKTSHAQRTAVESGIGSMLTWTSNSNLGFQTGRSAEDTVLAVSPRIAIRHDGTRVKLTGFAEANANYYAEQTLANRVLPIADLTTRAEAIERWLYLEGGVRAFQTSANPFGAIPSVVSSGNALTTTQRRFSPYIESSPTAGWRYRLRSDNTRTSAGGSTFAVAASNASGYFGQHTLLVQRDARPVGLQLDAQRSETRYDDTDQRLILDLARLSADYAIDDELTAGLRGGYERNSFSALDNKGSIYGLQARWQPSERTSLGAFREKRFFGTGWQVSFDHRAPRIAWSTLLERNVNTLPQALFVLPATDNVTALLDAIFTTRYPDPVERLRVVQDFIAQRGLPTSTLAPTNIYARRLSVVTSRTASVSLISARNVLVLSAFQARTEDLAGVNPLDFLNPQLTNNTQHGAAFVYNHRLSATVGMTGGFEWRRIRALQDAGPNRSEERAVRLQLSVQTNPKTNVITGVRYRLLDSNVSVEGEEGAIFVGLDQRF